jgi:hypothetical protein
LNHGGGDIQTTLREWSGSPVVVLDAGAERLWNEDATLPLVSKPNTKDLTFILSDDQALGALDLPDLQLRSLGTTWLQGHMAIGIVHFLLDEGVELTI